MRIDDLNYLENVLDLKTISGGVFVGVAAEASASGDSVFAMTDTTTKVKEKKNGGSKAVGRGVAIAIGDDPFAVVDVFGSGDKVTEKTKVKYFPNKDMMVAKGKVVAIDKP